MLVQAVVQAHGPAYCQGCGQMAPCTALTVECRDRAATVHHVFCQECIARGIGTEIAVPDQMIRHALAKRRRMSRRGERKTAREVGGRMTAASGAIGEDGDVLTEDWMIEEKQTQSRSFRVSVNLFDKAKRQAHRQSRDWVIRIKMPENNDIAVLDWRVWRGWLLSNDASD